MSNEILKRVHDVAHQEHAAHDDDEARRVASVLFLSQALTASAQVGCSKKMRSNFK